MSRRPIYVLGTGLSHDGSACLLKDGRIFVAIEKERLSRIKHDGGNDTLAIRYCLDVAGIEVKDLALVVQNANFGNFERGNAYFGGPRLFADGEGPPVVTISHHLAHAYSAFGMCPFAAPAVLVVDGCGNGLDECSDLPESDPWSAVQPELKHLYFEKDSYYSLRDGLLRVVYKDFSPWGMAGKGYPMLPRTTKHSIGGIYNAVTHYCLRDDSDPGKLMGLAPYGRPGIFTDEIFELRDGRTFLRYDWMRKFDRPARSTQDFKVNFQYYADIARWLQSEVERALLYLFDSRYEMEPAEDLAYAGGVALNAVANARLARQTRFRSLFVVPAAGDNGLALGCAFYGWLAVLERERVAHDGSTCFGRTYSRESIVASLEAAARSAGRVATESLGTIGGLLGLVHASFLPGKAQGWEGVLVWRAEGAGAYTTVVGGGRCILVAGQPASPAVEIAAKPANLLALLEGRVHPASAAAAGFIGTTDVDTLLTFFRCIDWEAVGSRLRSEGAAAFWARAEELEYIESSDIADLTARILAEGKIVAWFQGGSEFGPRALGHRSLLADPRRPEMREIINREIKRREDFRPFAPSVLLEEVGRYFDQSEPSPYMLTVAPIRPDWAQQLSSVVHCDGSARLQTVTEAWNPVYCELLRAFRRYTGISVLLNTSLNRKGMPIVETPTDAANFLRETPRLDALVIDRYLSWSRLRPPFDRME